MPRKLFKVNEEIGDYSCMKCPLLRLYFSVIDIIGSKFEDHTSMWNLTNAIVALNELYVVLI